MEINKYDESLQKIDDRFTETEQIEIKIELYRSFPYLRLWNTLKRFG